MGSLSQKGWGRGSPVEHLPDVSQASGSIPNANNNNSSSTIIIVIIIINTNNIINNEQTKCYKKEREDRVRNAAADGAVQEARTES